jgi:hypothetical protein
MAWLVSIGLITVDAVVTLVNNSVEACDVTTTMDNKNRRPKRFISIPDKK